MTVSGSSRVDRRTALVLPCGHRRTSGRELTPGEVASCASRDAGWEPAHQVTVTLWTLSIHFGTDTQVPTVSTIFPVDLRSIIEASASPARSSGRTRLTWGLSRPACHMPISSVMESPMADGRCTEYEPQ